ncbi:MAG: DUF3060 domain-containing protein [Myxococcales bacterium]|nr:DUF3060 domain-containing protein [Myxococcales bacterium]
MRTTLFALLAMTSLAAADVTVIDNHKTLEVDCAKDKEVNLLGNHITVTLKGVCTKVSLTGNHNSVTGSATTVAIPGNHNTATLDKVDTLAVPGNYNKATYKGPVTAPKTTVAVLGNKNSVTQQK